MFKSDGKVRELFRKYGKTALATHLTVYGASFAGMVADVIVAASVAFHSDCKLVQACTWLSRIISTLTAF